MTTPERPFESSNLRPENFPSVEDSLRKVDAILFPIVEKAKQLHKTHTILEVTDEKATGPVPLEPSVNISVDNALYDAYRASGPVAGGKKSVWIIVVQWEFDQYTVHDTFQRLTDGSVHCITEYPEQDLRRFGGYMGDEAAAALEADLRMQHPEEYEIKGLVDNMHERVAAKMNEFFGEIASARAKRELGASIINQVEAHRLAGALELPFVRQGIERVLNSWKEAR